MQVDNLVVSSSDPSAHHGGAPYFSIEDDGKGFDTSAVAVGADLQNMADRVHVLVVS